MRIQNNIRGVKLKDYFDWSMIGIIFSIYIIWRIGIIGHWDKDSWTFLLICLVGIRKDQVDIPWTRFFLIGIPLLGLFYYFYGAGDSIWWKIAHWLFNNANYPFRWDRYMNNIPLNNGAWARWYTSKFMDHFMIWVYNYGFVLSLWVALVRSFWTKSIKKMCSYALSGHLLQFPLILPFYNLFLVHEVWFVNHQPDLLHRHLSGNALLVNVMDCFPSMHTSISFAMLLLALREKDRIFKLLMVIYCVAIIYSTLYLQIHWLVDVFAGMAFAFGTVKLSDFLIHMSSTKWMPEKLRSFYAKHQSKSVTA